MSLPFRYFGDLPNDYLGNLSYTFDVVFERHPSRPEREALAQALHASLAAFGDVLVEVGFSTAYARIRISPDSPPEASIQRTARAMHDIVPLRDAVWLDARDATGPLTRAARSEGPPSAGPRGSQAADARLQRPIDPTLPQAAPDAAFDAALARARRASLIARVDAHQRRPGQVGFEHANGTPPAEAPFDPNDPRFADWPDLGDLKLTRPPSFHADGKRCLVVHHDVVFELNVADRTSRMLCRSQTDDTGHLHAAVWVDEAHFVVASDSVLRAYRRTPDGVVESSALQQRGLGHLASACGGRLVISTHREVYAGAVSGRTVFASWDGRALATIGGIDVPLVFAGEGAGRVWLRLGDHLFHPTHLDQALPSQPAASAEPEGLALGDRVDVPMQPLGLKHRQGNRTLSAPATRGTTCEGLLLEERGQVTDLGPLLLQSLTSFNSKPTNAVAIATQGPNALVVAGQGPIGSRAVLVGFDLETRTTLGSLEHDGTKLGKVLSVEPVDDELFAVFTPKAVVLIAVSASGVVMTHSRKHKDGGPGAVVEGPRLAVPTRSKDGLLLLGITPKRRLKILEKSGIPMRAARWHEGALVVQDGQRVWRELTGLAR